MINLQNDKYKYWMKNPIDIDPEENINENVFNSPGYIIRDYRFYPKLLPADMSKYEIKNGIRRCPSKLQLFYAWELSNEQQALKNNKKYTKYRNKSVNKIELKRFNKMYLKKQKVYFIYNEIVRRDCINLIDTILNTDKYDDEINDNNIDKFYSLIQNLNLMVNDYNESIYKEFVETLLTLIHYIDLKESYTDESSIHLTFDKLVIINKIIKSINL